MDENILTSHGRALLSRFLEENALENKLESFDKITELYYGVNSVINISALKTPDDIYIKHYLDSIFPYKHFSGRCCDVGCGGGFPCLPLAVVTDLRFLGIDGVGKKLTLIDRCKSALGLNNIESRHARAEELKAKGERFDTVCARAVADTDKVLSYCAPLAASGGKIILYKTQNDDKAKPETEKKQKLSLFKVVDYTLSGTDINRRLFIYQKN